MILKILLAVTVIIAIYAAFLRPWLRKQPWADGFFHAIEPFEMSYLKSESLLWSRWLVALGGILTMLSQLDPTMIQAVAQVLPENYRWIATVAPLAISLAGLMGERLRRDTTKPLALVAVRDTASVEVKDAVRDVEQTNAAAVQAINKDAA